MWLESEHHSPEVYRYQRCSFPLQVVHIDQMLLAYLFLEEPLNQPCHQALLFSIVIK